MSGSGRKIYQPGEVLTASNVQNYLMDQAVQYYAGTAARGSAIGTATTEGMMSYLADTNTVQMATGTATWVNVDSIPIVSGTATRDALYPSPVAGNTVHRTDLGFQETYYAAAGTPTRAAGWYSGQNGGLVPILPSSVVVSSGTATVAQNGNIGFTTVGSISLNNVFTDAYTFYRIMFKAKASVASANSQFRFRIAGTDKNTAYYGASHYSLFTGTASNGDTKNNGNEAYFGNMGQSHNVIVSADVDVNANNFASIHGTIMLNYSGGGQYFGYNTTTTTKPDGFSIFPTSGTITGELQIYGYRK